MVVLFGIVAVKWLVAQLDYPERKEYEIAYRV